MASEVIPKTYYLNAPLSKLRFKVGIQPYEGAPRSDELKLIHWQERIENPIVQFRDNTALLPHDYSNLNERIFTRCPDVPENQTPEDGPHLRRRKPRRQKTKIVDLPSKEQREHNRQIDFSATQMEILVFLGVFDRESDPKEDKHDVYTLCTIKAYGTNCLIFDPDYADRNIGIETRHGMYKVTLKVDEYKEFSALNEKPSTEEHLELFEVSDRDEVHLSYLLQIERGINFPRTQYYIEYKLDLPTHISAQETSLLAGRTQSCYIKEDDDGNEVTHFGFPLQFDLLAKEASAPHRALLWPRLLFRVCSEDYWGRHYVDGYGSYSLPVETHANTVTVPTWRPVDSGVSSSALKELFIGQAVDLTAIELISPSSSEHNKQSRIGITTESSGFLEIKCECVMHSKRFVSEAVMKHLKYGKLMSRIGMNASLHWRIMKVLMEFENAKRELLKLGTHRNQKT
ncbi:hypothetical protein QR680_008868 [Steinernema hermaphroditum]|uniref:Meckel syndrome type 1 protein n=1 Tax=Steinernema hermaphroditum TaxID=289476 RepID=A0AA39M8P1_9BILA|nr:hypothetical protein QR680_008868 [Steinernema hermaphroditum]